MLLIHLDESGRGKYKEKELACSLILTIMLIVIIVNYDIMSAAALG